MLVARVSAQKHSLKSNNWDSTVLQFKRKNRIVWMEQRSGNSGLSRHITFTCVIIQIPISLYLLRQERVWWRSWLASIKGISWSGLMCTAWIFIATRFTAYRKTFAFHFSTPVSGVHGNFDDNSTKKKQPTPGCQVAFRRKLVDHLSKPPFKNMKVEFEMSPAFRELPVNHYSQNYVVSAINIETFLKYLIIW